MASFSNSPRIILHFLLLMLSPPFIAAGQTLIESECFNSKTPETCMKCLKSDPGSEKADRVGIATILVNCISSQAETLATNMSDLYSFEKDLELMNIYYGCNNQYSSAKLLLNLAKQKLQNHDYDTAERFVVGSLSFDSACHDNCKDFPDKVPGDVFDRMKTYEELSEDAFEIIERLK